MLSGIGTGTVTFAVNMSSHAVAPKRVVAAIVKLANADILFVDRHVTFLLRNMDKADKCRCKFSLLTLGQDSVRVLEPKPLVLALVFCSEYIVVYSY